jgi:predicted unusual protein kinase regulating ubiquinone biosynthesis (AarF/ABC1/UbiB family)
VAGYERYRPISRTVPTCARWSMSSRAVTLEELDYLAEGRNAEIFRRQLQVTTRVSGVPAVVWNLSTRRVLTLEDVSAIRIGDYEAITAAGNRPCGRRGRCWRTSYRQQILQDGFFHADPHPGNLFVTPIGRVSTRTASPNWKLTFIDFGMIGRIPDTLRSGPSRGRSSQ